MRTVTDKLKPKPLLPVLSRLAGGKRLLARSIALIPLVTTGACSSVDVLNTLSSASPHTSVTGIPFGPLPRHQLDIYQPTGKDTRPVVVFFYGGSWNRGERKDYAFIGHSLASRGYLTVIPDYRLYPEVRYPDFLHDNARAVAWAHANVAKYGGDPSRMIVMGHSAGAYNAAMMALDARWLAPHQLKPDVFRAWVGISGAYNFLPIGTPDVQPVFFHPDYPKDSQPIDFVSAGAPASFLASSPEDDLINPKRNTFALADRLQKSGVSTTLKTYPPVDHVSIIASLAWPLRFKAPLLDDIDQFLQKQLHDTEKTGGSSVSNLNTMSKTSEKMP